MARATLLVPGKHIVQIRLNKKEAEQLINILESYTNHMGDDAEDEKDYYGELHLTETLTQQLDKIIPLANEKE